MRTDKQKHLEAFLLLLFASLDVYRSCVNLLRSDLSQDFIVFIWKYEKCVYESMRNSQDLELLDKVYLLKKVTSYALNCRFSA